MKIGKHLKAARISAKMTQEELSYAANVDRSYLSELERNIKSPTLDMLSRLCKEMGVKVSSLIIETENDQSD